MSIKVLDSQVVNQIAAGEVIERPVSVVRELVDNSLDAGASLIEIRIEQGGQSFIQVRDDGSGIAPTEAELAFQRHATSKLEKIEDLQRIRSLGFRGEALAAISSVSKIKLSTRTQDAHVGLELTIVPGSKVARAESSEPVGTCIEVRELFFNQPARLKFLKSARSDEQKIRSWIKQISLAHPQVRFRLWSDDKELLNLQRRESAWQRAKELFGPNSIEINHVVGPLTVSGLVLHPGFAAPDSALLLFVNRRLVSDRMLIRAVKDGFQSMLKERELPVGAIFIDVLPEFVDVNVHPQKSEVRFRSPQAVFQAVYGAIRASLSGMQSPVVAFNQTAHSGGGAITSFDSVLSTTQAASPAVSWGAQASFDLVLGGINAQQTALPGREPFRFSDLRYVGQLLQCYLVCEHQEQLVIVDMHAAHERYNYNLLRANLERNTIGTQHLLTPISIEFGAMALDSIQKNSALLERFGFEIEAQDERRMLVKGVPAILPNLEIESFLKELAEYELSEMMQRKLEELIDAMAARLACHASIRSGDMLSRDKAYALFASLDQSEFSTACPHGRPVVVSFERDQIEKWFGRDR